MAGQRKSPEIKGFRAKRKGRQFLSKLPTFYGGDEGIRTLDLTDANRTLSQLSYAPVFACPAALPAANTWNYTIVFQFVKPYFPLKSEKGIGA